MIQIGKYKLGFAALSMVAVFVVLSVCAVIAAFHQARAECPMPRINLIFINEIKALLVTLVYGIFAHFALSIINRIK